LDQFGALVGLNRIVVSALPPIYGRLIIEDPDSTGDYRGR
jgi:hypothetical protein